METIYLVLAEQGDSFGNTHLEVVAAFKDEHKADVRCAEEQKGWARYVWTDSIELQ